MTNEKRRIVIICIALAILALASVAVLIIVNLNSGAQAVPALDEPAKTTRLLHLNQNVSDVEFTDADGQTVVPVSEYGVPLVMVYWASWCPDCKDGLQYIDALAGQSRDLGAELILIDRLEDGKETKQQALAYLSDNHISTATLFDEGRMVYDRLVGAMIPTAIVIDGNGSISGTVAGYIPSINELAALINEARTGKQTALMSFLREKMLGRDGGIKTALVDDGNTPSGDDVLSESLGIMMLCAAELNDKELFDHTLSYTLNHKCREDAAITSWVTQDQYVMSATNAAIDDLRIYRALTAANKLWGGYDEQITALETSLLEYNVDKERLMDFYDFSTNTMASRLTLCYADLNALELLKSRDPSWNKVYDSALAVVENGVISQSFPLYHSYFDYMFGSYSSDVLNMSEALTTLYNLACVDKLPAASKEWLYSKLNEGRIFGRYTANGQPSSDGMYESTAVYALAALIAHEEGDTDMANRAITLMEQQKIKDVENEFNGAFGNPDGTGVFSFDQLMALCAYQALEGDGNEEA